MDKKNTLILAAFGLTLMSAGSAQADCFIGSVRFNIAINENVSVHGQTDSRGCYLQFRAGGRQMFTTASIVSPAHGGVLSQDGPFAFGYRVKKGFAGSDSFALKICGKGPAGSGCSIVSYSMAVN